MKNLKDNKSSKLPGKLKFNRLFNIINASSITKWKKERYDKKLNQKSKEFQLELTKIIT